MVASVFLFYFCSPGLALCRHYVHANNTGAHTHVACLCCRHCPVIECLSALLGAPVFASSRAVSFPCGLFAGQESRLALARCEFVCASLHRQSSRVRDFARYCMLRSFSKQVPSSFKRGAYSSQLVNATRTSGLGAVLSTSWHFSSS